MLLGRFGLLLMVSLAVGCGAEARLDFKGTDISSSSALLFAPVPEKRRLALTDHTGRSVTLESLKGKLVVLFFGYTHCPDVCPTTLSDMAQALKSMRAEDASQVQVLFVSVDPARDTPEILRAYVPYFHPGFLGLYGTPEQVAEAAQEFRVVYRKHVQAGVSDYLIDHSAGSYVLDKQGQSRLYLPYAMSAADIAHDLSVLLKAS